MGTQPTGIALPELLIDLKTRVGGEFHLFYNFGQAYKYGAIGVGPTAVQYRAEDTCGGSASLPVSGFAAVRALNPLQAAIESEWGVDDKTGFLPAYAPIGQAAEIGRDILVPSAANVVADGGEPGDGVEIIVLPNPANDVLICFDQGLNIDIGTTVRPIGRKFNQVDHYVRQRGNNQLTLNDLYVCNVKGVASLRQRPVTLKYVIYPSGGSIPLEIGYFTNVMLNVPKSYGQDPNESVNINATGSFNDELIFTAPVS